MSWSIATACLCSKTRRNWKWSVFYRSWAWKLSDKYLGHCSEDNTFLHSRCFQPEPEALSSCHVLISTNAVFQTRGRLFPASSTCFIDAKRHVHLWSQVRTGLESHGLTCLFIYRSHSVSIGNRNVFWKLEFQSFRQLQGDSKMWRGSLFFLKGLYIWGCV